MNAERVASLAQSNVDVIHGCLNADEVDHAWECEEEHWFAELGERAALAMGIAAAVRPWFAFLTPWLAWQYRRELEGVT